MKNKIKLEHLLLFIILAFSAFFRLYRLDRLLGFWYDQGRDALIIWDLLHYGKFFLIGPVTGIDGIFLGPFYYYLLTPFYWLGKGSPVMAAAGLSWLTVGTVYLIYWLGKKIYGWQVGLLAAFLYGFSYSQVVFSRWLANPNPLPFFTLLVLVSLVKYFEKQKVRDLLLVSLFTGLCLQLEAASAIWFLPALFLIFLGFGRKKITAKGVVLAGAVFFLTLLPQIVFSFRHDGVLYGAFQKFLVADKSFGLSFWQTVKYRLMTYYDVFPGKLFFTGGLFRLAALALFSATLLIYRKKIFNQGGKILAIWLIAPLFGFFFYQGNHGYVWDYYFTGVIPAFILLFASGLWVFYRKGLLPKVMVYSLLIAFVGINTRFLINYLKFGRGITIGAQTKAIDWIYRKAEGRPFNADFYVPPQIYFSYSYLMKWYGEGVYGYSPETKSVSELYTLYEPDGEHPQFLEAWLARQSGLGKIEDEYFWGDVTVQKRERLKDE